MRGAARHDVPATTCPACGERLDEAVSATDPRPPRPGDLTVCNFCGAQLEIGPGGALVLLSEAARAALRSDERRDLDRAAATVRKHLARPRA